MVAVHSSGSGSVGRASPCQGEGRGFESRLPLHFFAQSIVARRATGRPREAAEPVPAPSSNGRTADFESVNRGSIPRGAATLFSHPVPSAPELGQVVAG